MRLADYFVSRLIEAGVETVFTVTGRGSLYLTDALARRPEIRVVAMHNEQSASYGAVASADISGRLSVCLVSTGCAMTNAVSGVLSAWQDELPVLFVSGQHTLSETTRFSGSSRRTFGEQETDIALIVGSITKMAQMVTSPAEFDDLFNLSIMHALTGRKGPVWIDIPLDLQSARIEPEAFDKKLQIKSSKNVEANVDVNDVAEKLAKSLRPVFLVGGGLRRDGGVVAFRKLLEKVRIPVVFDSSAVDVYGSANQLSIGSVGAMGCSRAGNIVLQKSDFVIALGSQLRSSLVGERPKSFVPNGEILLVDVDDSCVNDELSSLSGFIASDVLHFVEALDLETEEVQREDWVAWSKFVKTSVQTYDYSKDQDSRIDLYHLSDVLSEVLSDQSIVVTESGLTELIIPTMLEFRLGQRSVHPVSQGAMGFGLPAAIGVCAETRSEEVVLVTGEGSLMMNVQELQTIRHHQLPIKIVVVENGGYAVIRKRQSELFRGRTIGTDSSNGISFPDLRALADVFGLKYRCAERASELKTTLIEFLSQEGPALCEIKGLENQEYVRVARSRANNGELQSRPIDDQFPFLGEAKMLEITSALRTIER